MCRSIKTLRKEPDWTEEDARAAALQYVRKLSGYRAPSKKNEAVFQEAVDDITKATLQLLNNLG
jgi:hypothetical protein